MDRAEQEASTEVATGVEPIDPPGHVAPLDDALDARALHGRAVAVVSRAIDAGDVDVAVRVLALGDPAARRRRRWLTAVALAATAVVCLVAGVLVGGALEGGTAGEDAPAPLALGDLGSSVVDPGVAGASVEGAAVDGATTDVGALDPAAVDAPTATTAPAEVLGTSVTAASAGGAGGSAGATGSAAPTAAGRPAVTTPAPTVRAGTPTTPSPSPSPTPTAAPTTVAPAGGALDGAWTATASQAGYRISKTWTLGGSTEEVVGRTARVAGALTIAGDRLTAANVVVDMGSIDSGNLIRDAAFREQLLLTGGNPDARFDLAAPVDLSTRPAAGQTFTTRAAGKLRVRGVVRDVVADLQARQNGAALQVVGSIAVKLADFGVPNPSFALATVADRATIEFSVTYNRA